MGPPPFGAPPPSTLRGTLWAPTLRAHTFCGFGPPLLWAPSLGPRMLDLGQFDLGQFDLGNSTWANSTWASFLCVYFVFLWTTSANSTATIQANWPKSSCVCVCCVCLLCVSAVCVGPRLRDPPTPRPSAEPSLRRTAPPPDRPKFRFFFLLPPPFSFFLSLSGCLLVSFFPLSGCLLVYFAGRRSTFEVPTDQNTTKIPREDPQRERRKKENCCGRGKEKREIVGSHLSGPQIRAPRLLPRLAQLGLGQIAKSMRFFWPKSNWPNSNGPCSDKPVGLRIGKSSAPFWAPFWAPPLRTPHNEHKNWPNAVWPNSAKLGWPNAASPNVVLAKFGLAK